MRMRFAAGLLAAVALAATTAPAYAVDADDVNRAIDRGVALLRRTQGATGEWSHAQIGATALAGLTLLECGAADDDKAVLRAAAAVRRRSITLTHTYSISLSILFLDRLGDAGDVPLIESLMVRLLAGQDGMGGWTYQCPAVGGPAETRRLEAKVKERKELVARRGPPKERPKRTIKDLPEEIQQQLALLQRGAVPAGPGAAPPMMGMGIGDNSNTQFAALALWVGRRHGLPVEGAVTRLDRRFRGTQMEDGGWAYTAMGPGPSAIATGMGLGSTASMTCAGLLGLAIADGAVLEYLKERKPDAKLPKIDDDKNLKKGLQALSSVVENPKNIRLQPAFAERKPDNLVGGRTFYFLWSLERVAVALDLKTIGKKDWYGWGAEILLANQQTDGGWRGDYAESGADTCFALLFLKRANLARDLTAQLGGKIKDPGEREIRAGGIGGDSLRGVKKTVKSGIESKDAKPIRKPLAGAADSESARLASRLVESSGGRQAELLEQMRDEKGVKYTEALATAIPKLEGEAHRKARQALAERLTRLKATSLALYLQDEDAEIRRAAALAVAMKPSKPLIPNLIPLLGDSEMPVVHAAYAALKDLTGQDFGPAAKANREERELAVLKWQRWWNRQKK